MKRFVRRFLNRLMAPSMESLLPQIESRLIINRQEINRMMQMNQMAYRFNEAAFREFKNANAGRDVIVFATGPSLAKFKPIEGCVKIGINHAFMQIHDLDYLFSIDYKSVCSVADDIRNYRGNNCLKFFNYCDAYFNAGTMIPESYIIETGARRFITDYVNAIGMPESHFVYDICSVPLFGGGSGAFPAMQFALWTNPRRIYLVGCDCSSGGHFFNEQLTKADTRPQLYLDMVGQWKRLKKFGNVAKFGMT